MPDFFIVFGDKQRIKIAVNQYGVGVAFPDFKQRFIGNNITMPNNDQVWFGCFSGFQ